MLSCIRSIRLSGVTECLLRKTFAQKRMIIRVSNTISIINPDATPYEMQIGITLPALVGTQGLQEQKPGAYMDNSA